MEPCSEPADPPPIRHLYAEREIADGSVDFAADATLTGDQVAAISALTSEPVSSSDRIEGQLARWERKKRSLATDLSRWRQGLPEHKRNVIGKLDPFIMALMLDESCHADKHFIRDLLAGFPVTGRVSCGGLGPSIPGGQRSRGRPDASLAMDVDVLRARCSELNAKVIARAREKVPVTLLERELAQEVWNKTKKDMAFGRAGVPHELADIELDSVLLVEVFGVWEQHGAAQSAQVRGIHNFRSNGVNECAWMPEKLVYDGFDHMKSALGVATSSIVGHGLEPDAAMGKSDFKSAFKTIPASDEHEWLCWALVYNPDEGRLQAVPIYSQVFGSLGGVTGWYRTARAIQHIMLTMFFVAIFFYVDDAFWAARAVILPNGQTQVVWIGSVFKRVVSGLLGWELDPAKEECGQCIQLLGLQVHVSGVTSFLSMGARKSRDWALDIRTVLVEDHISPGMASKFCGRLAFLNANVFNRLGRALLWPLI